MCRVRVTPDLELATGLASAGPLDVGMRLFGGAGTTCGVWPRPQTCEMLSIAWWCAIAAVRLGGQVWRGLGVFRPHSELFVGARQVQRPILDDRDVPRADRCLRRQMTELIRGPLFGMLALN